VTSRQGEAHDLVKTLNPAQVTGVVVVSGDGLVSEVVNGLMARPDWREVAAHVTLGHIPGGSGNGVAKSVLAASQEPYSPTAAAFLIVKGFHRRVDLLAARVGASGEASPANAPVFGLLSSSWGLVSDIDFESESMRCVGGARFTLQALACLAAPREYSGTLAFVPHRNMYTRLSRFLPPRASSPALSHTHHTT